MSGPANDSRFSSTSNYFVASATAEGGSVLESTVLINPLIGTNTAEILNTIAEGGDFTIGSSIAHPKTIQLVETAPPNGKGYVVINADTNPDSIGLTLAGGPAGTASGLINMGSNTGDEVLTIGSNASSSFNNIVLTEGLTTINSYLQTAVDADITCGGVYRISNDAPNVQGSVGCPITDSGVAVEFTPPPGLLPGLYAITISEGVDAGGFSIYYASGLIYWDGVNWTSGGFNNNPGNFPGFGVRLGALGNVLAFCNGTPDSIGLGGVVINFRLALAGGPSSNAQLAPFG